MDSSQLASEVRDWLQESGVMREMQTRLRAKMIDRIMMKGGGKLKGGEKVESECTERQRAINSLIFSDGDRDDETALHSRAIFERVRQ
jgi:hypothetical protein